MPTPLLPTESFTVAEAAKRLGVSSHTLRKMLREKRLGGFKLMNQWRVTPSDLRKFIKERRNV